MAKHGAATLGHAVHFALLDFEALSLREQSEHFGDHDDALAANADDEDIERVLGGISHQCLAIRRRRDGTDGGDWIAHCITGAAVLMQSTVQTWAQSVQPMQSDWSICTLWRPSNDWSLQVIAGQPRFMHA